MHNKKAADTTSYMHVLVSHVYELIDVHQEFGIAAFNCSAIEKKNHLQSIQGLHQHETLRHPHYNIPSLNLIDLPQQHINEIKETLVYLIQTWLKINTASSGSQCILIPCTESEFVEIFRDFIDRYSPGSNQYLCIFQGSNAYETLGKLLNRPNWGVRKYQHGQEIQVTFVDEFITNSKSPEQTEQVQS
ncbi:11790_t:CDS:2 [Racocetra fulgida]|uniref:11790_t:CDS:1 n=1 Tax=Racocetra fulgida TaxID=60492 RepID=A0A9N9CK11_9GLOM|nr:11790_t:CDS:2 [Racocetra fulgida]